MVACIIGATIFGWAMSKNMSHESLNLRMLGVAAFSMGVSVMENLHIRSLGFFIFEACVGMYWPCMGSMRAKYVPEESRATIMNIFRIPLNIIVVLALLKVSEFPTSQVFLYNVVLLSAGWLCQYSLNQLLSAEKALNPYEVVSTEELKNTGAGEL